MKSDYPLPFIYKLLEHYSNLVEGRWFENEYGERRRTSSSRATFEAPTIAKADLDLAINTLGSTERDVIKCHYILGFELDYIENKLHINASRAIKTGVREMGLYLNGECVLRRWAKENGFINKERIMQIPDYLSDEINQYVKDICLDYCVSAECPK